MTLSESRYPTEAEARASIVEIGRRMFERGYVASNDGNISVRVALDEVVVTPTGVSKGYMTEDMMARVRLDDTVLSQGDSRPSSESKMHLRIYKENPEVNAVVHAHPIYATTLAVAGIPLDMPYLTEGILQLGTVPIAGYAEPGSQDVPDGVAPYCKDYSALLLANHGSLTWGSTLTQAYSLMETVEACSQIAFNVMQLGKSRSLSHDQIEGLRAIRKRQGLPDIVLPSGVDEPENLEDVPSRK